MPGEKKIGLNQGQKVSRNKKIQAYFVKGGGGGKNTEFPVYLKKMFFFPRLKFLAFKKGFKKRLQKR